MRYACISDIHGRGTELLYMIPNIEKKMKEKPTKLVFLGDYLDRGKENLLVCSIILNLIKKYPDSFILKGNPEEFLLGSYEYAALSKVSYLKRCYSGSKSIKQEWFHPQNGGKRTYEELEGNEQIKKEFINLVKKMPSIVVDNSIVFTHAPIYDLSPEDSTLDNRLWNFENYSGEPRLPYINVHGHLHQFKQEKYPMIDTLFKKINVSHYPNLKVCYIGTDDIKITKTYF